MSKKFKFSINKLVFTLPSKYLITTDYQGNECEPKIKMNQVATASVVKQYVKLKYPNVVVSSSSSSFANGNSSDVFISDERGNEVEESIISDVRAFGCMFTSGSYNSWEESYEYKQYNGTTDGGTIIDSGCKWLHISNRPKFVSVPDIYRMISDMTTSTQYVFGMISLEKAIEHVKGYGGTQTNINKALQLF